MIVRKKNRKVLAKSSKNTKKRISSHRILRVLNYRIDDSPRFRSNDFTSSHELDIEALTKVLKLQRRKLQKMPPADARIEALKRLEKAGLLD